MGCGARRIESTEEVAPDRREAHEIADRPVVLEFRTDASEKVFPMVPSGKTNDEVQVGPQDGKGGA